MNEIMIPTIGARVARRDDVRRERLGHVDAHGDAGSGRVGVRWQGGDRRVYEAMTDLTSGFKPGMQEIGRAHV